MMDDEQRRAMIDRAMADMPSALAEADDANPAVKAQAALGLMWLYGYEAALRDIHAYDQEHRA